MNSEKDGAPEWRWGGRGWQSLAVKLAQCLQRLTNMVHCLTNKVMVTIKTVLTVEERKSEKSNFKVGSSPNLRVPKACQGFREALVTASVVWMLLLVSTYCCHSGFGGLEVACWPLVPKFAGSNSAEAVGFFRAKKSSARLPSEGK